MKDWTEIISEARDRNKEKEERKRRLKIAKTAMKGSAALGKSKSGKNDCPQTSGSRPNERRSKIPDGQEQHHCFRRIGFF